MILSSIEVKKEPKKVSITFIFERLLLTIKLTPAQFKSFLSKLVDK